MEDTICAISTPLGKGAVSIVRLSGNKSLKIMEEVFSSKSLSYNQIQPRFMYFGKFDLGEDATEKCLAVYFKSPFSYTGEDLVEFQIHGGTLLTQKVLSRLLECGARLARAGEFTKRAFENGKISLDMAESIIGEINAENEGELKASLNLAQGKLAKRIKELQSSLAESIAQIEATLDYPEEDFEKSAKEEIFKNITNVDNVLSDFICQAQNAKYITNGINVAIVGAPNVGKSSLLNALIGVDRAIVTDIAGTTRDVLTESVGYKGISLNFIDTAGIRDSEDVVEKIGIEKSKNSISSADVVLFVLDGSRQMQKYDQEIDNLLKNKKNVIKIINKSDLPRVLSSTNDEIVISALKEDNILSLKEKIFTMVIDEDIDFNKDIIISARQIDILKECKLTVQSILASQQQSMDVIAMLIKQLWNGLGKITGESENESIIDLIFSKFCLGK
ncbi:MAG: tRNA uridine-5-carboxymethylaminomethyl(34) synthesis GTPase MnmE [Clostridiales bacterium]|nr:tRNA uridine-5-carboxymethylaminomethyl(34) synthesis GTPase MnmE [Clostridiales bacterium]